MASLTGMTLVELVDNKSDRISDLLHCKAMRFAEVVKPGPYMIEHLPCNLLILQVS